MNARSNTRSVLLLCGGPLRFVPLVLLLLAGPAALAQAPGLWSDVPPGAVLSGAERPIVPDRFRSVRLERRAMADMLAAAPREQAPLDIRNGITLSLPTPDGGFATFRVVEAPVLAPKIQARYPQIRSYYGRAVDRPGTAVRISVTPDGFRALVLGRETFLIDPIQEGDAEHYVVYRKADYTPDPDRVFEAFGNEVVEDAQRRTVGDVGTLGRPNGETFRTYRLALAATGEYTAYHSTRAGNAPNVADALAAQVVAMTRVNGIYERDLAIRMVIIDDNEDIIYTDGLTDPYTNNDADALLNENQENLTTEIGAANYDIGHVFTTGGGGKAMLGVVCNDGSKARGETGLGEPINDVFYVDFVAHEIGHQFNGNHTFNGDVGNCDGQRNGSTAYEPGSGSTIMAYADICGAQNIQSFSDDYFHNVSLNEIVDFVTDGGGNACGTATPTGNAPPVASAENDGATIPIGTPFFLRGSATDDGPASDLTYAWEEFDLGSEGPPPGAADWSGTPPFFRSFEPVAEPVRYFPQLSGILAGTDPVLGERLPTDERTLTFRMTARDNAGGIDDVEIQINTDADAGPFVVLFANATGLAFDALSEQTVTWDVAGTDANDVNTEFVDILLSTDNGLTFAYPLALATPNDGSHVVTLPDVVTDGAATGRIMIVGSGNIFFDVNDQPFVLDPANEPPVANAGPDQTVEATSAAGADVTLNGTGSSDPDGDALTYSWSEAGSEVATGATPTLGLGLGSHTLTLTVTDPFGESDTDVVVVQVEDTTPPVITLNGDAVVTIECGTGTYTELGATASDLVDGTVTVAITGSVDATMAGSYVIAYNATDAAGNAAEEVTRTVNVVDTTPPTLTVDAEPLVLWPANHDYHTVSLDDLGLAAGDDCDGAVGPDDVVILSVTSDEAENAWADGNTTEDIVVDDCRTVRLRAERQGRSDGRVYTLTLAVADAAGNLTTATYEVHVPKSESEKTAVAGPPAYTVDGCSLAAIVAATEGTEATSDKDGAETAEITAERHSETSPTAFALHAAYPNPFARVASLAYDVPEATVVRLTVYDVQGRVIARLADGPVEAGRHAARFDATGLPSGTYLVRLVADSGFIATQRLTVVR